MAVTKTDGGVDYRASDYADVSDPEKPSTWKLRISEGSAGNVTVAQVARAITALQPGGFRGNRVDLGDRKAAVISKLSVAINKSNGDDTQKANLRKRLTAVKEIALFAVDELDEQLEDAAKELAGEKHEHDDDCAPAQPYRPYGGATSFSELERVQKANEYVSVVDTRTYQLREIISNITNDENLSPAQRATAIQAAAEEYKLLVEAIPMADPYSSMKAGRRINSEKRGIITRLADEMKKLAGWAEYDDGADGGDGADGAAAKEAEELPAIGGFKVYRDKAGDLRWLSLSSNAFEDLDRELFTTDALKEAVEQCDKEGERGPLLIYHVPTAEIGRCDYQAVIGRFLVESGTFDSTPVGLKAADYYVNSEKEHQVSIGYQYHPGDEEDGTYDWLRIMERSVTPYGAAANPWTDFSLVGGKDVDAKKKDNLVEILGATLADGVIAAAESKTKDMEGSGTRFKEKGADPAILEQIKGMKAAIASMEAGEVRTTLEASVKTLSDGLGIKDEAESGGEEAAAPAIDLQPYTDALTTVATALNNLTDELAGVKTSIGSIETKVKALERTDDEKVAAAMTPRLQVVPGARPTESTENVIDPAKAKELGKDNPGEGADNTPVSGFVEDILRQGRALSATG